VYFCCCGAMAAAQ